MYTQEELEALKNTLLASLQPIPASKHRLFEQAIIDELYDAQSRGDILSGVQQTPSSDTDDLFFMIRGGQAYLVNLPVNPLQRVSMDVSVSNPIMNMGNLPERVHVGSAPVSSDKELSFSNASNLIRATTFITISGSTRNITVPSNVLTDISKWTWSKPSTKLIWAADPGVYRMIWTSDGTNIHLDIFGLYTNTP